MCRVVGYLGAPHLARRVLYETDSSLVRQSYSPRMMETFLNLAGFGMAAWDHALGPGPRSRSSTGSRRSRSSTATCEAWPRSSRRRA